MKINIKYGGEAVMQWERKGGKRSYVGLELGKKRRSREGKERRLKWKGRS